METNNITRLCYARPPRHLEYARNLATRLGKQSISTRIGVPIKQIAVTETISEKTRRILATCDTIVCINAKEPKPEPKQEQPEPGEEQEEMGDDWDSFVKDHLIVVHVGK